MISADPLLGSALHAVGAFCAAVCYMPQKGARGWSWQTYWLAQAIVCWLILPTTVAALTIPQLGAVLTEAPRGAMLTSFVLGALYGVGGTAFGIAIRYIGFSLTYAIAIGISCILGTLIPPLLAGTLGGFFGRPGSQWIVIGLLAGVVGIFTTGLAGRLKEKDLVRADSKTSFDLKRGLPLCILAGVLSAVFGISLSAGQPIADVAAAKGAGVFQGNVIYIFACGGAFLTTAVYCLGLHWTKHTGNEYLSPPKAGPPLPVHYLLAALTGLLWYGQFFFYGLGHVRMGTFQFTSWAIHMIMLVLFSASVGLWLREWKETAARTRAVLWLSLAILLAAVISLTYGNRVAELAIF